VIKDQMGHLVNHGATLPQPSRNAITPRLTGTSP
jgi:hypothetical protein